MSALITPGSPGWTDVYTLRKMGHTLPQSQTMARQEAFNTTASVNNRTLTAAMNRVRLQGQRMGGHTRTAANIQMALPKIRQPLSSLTDKGIPFNVEDPKELEEIRRWSRLFYSTHNLVPLLIDIYSKFPVVGMEFTSKDNLIQKFYEQMFMQDLNYMEFLPDSVGREYYTVGEVNTFAHFNESLGIWSSEEILNPDQIRVSKSLFVERERVQLMVKDLVEGLRDGPDAFKSGGGLNDSLKETESEKKERLWQYDQLRKHYPEIIEAAAQEDGLDISDALLSRIVNRTTPWATRGTPFLMRSFRTLMMEESLNAAQDAVSDRLYSPFILATLGVPDLGDGEPWIPDQNDLEECRDDMQNALAADFRLMVHNFGLKVESVFGRESVPRFDQDYERIERQLLQAWGIGEALISGGSGGAYASSALNREFVTQMMVGFQNALRRHIMKRAEIIAEAQEHYDFELKGGLRKPLFREIVETDEETGEEYIVKAPKLLLPEVKFSTLNLRDEAQEREFIGQLKQMGVPISDGTLAVNIPIEFKQELEKEADETVSKIVAKAQAMAKAQKLLDEQGLPYPEDLAMHLQQTLNLRALKSQVEMAEGQEELMDQQVAQMSPAGQLGILPGVPPPPPEEPEEGESGAPDFFAASRRGAVIPTGPSASGPTARPPETTPPEFLEFEVGFGTGDSPTKEVPRNRTRPEESDDQRGSEPGPPGGKISRRKRAKFGAKPSSYKRSHKATDQDAERAVNRIYTLSHHEASANPNLEDLIRDPEFWAITNMQNYEGQIQADFPEIMDGGASQSRQLLKEAVEMYEMALGVEVQGVEYL
jgi:hypothetical protein